MASSLADNPMKALLDTVERNGAVVLSLPSAGLLRHFRTRFLGEDPQGLWIELPRPAEGLVRDAHSSRTPLAASFRVRDRRMNFITTILRAIEQLRINAHSETPATLVQKPDKVTAVQRRSAYRVGIRPEDGIALRVWLISERAPIDATPAPAQEIATAVRDLSVGGAGVVLQTGDREPTLIVPNQRLRLELTCADASVVLEGRIRADCVRPDGSCGIVFSNLHDTLEGRRALSALTRIVADLQRDEARRARLWNTE